MAPPPRIISLLALLASLFCALTALAGIPLAAMDQRWYMLAFEVVVLVSSSIGVLQGLGRVQTGPAIGMLCNGGVVCVAAILSEPTLVANVMQGSRNPIPPLLGISILPWILARLGTGAALIALSGLTVLLRKPGESFPLLVRGVLAGAPVVALAAAMVLPAVRGRFLALPGLAQVMLFIVGVFVVGVLVSISGHCIIRAFEIGAVSEPDPRRKAGTA